MQNKTGAERLACSVTRLGDFLKFFATNSLTKVKKIVDFWDIFIKMN